MPRDGGWTYGIGRVAIDFCAHGIYIVITRCNDDTRKAAMSTAIRTRLVKIGNSQGIRIPKTVIEQIGLGDDVELEVRDRQLVVRAASRPRAGWEEQFQLMAERGDDKLLDDDSSGLTHWDESEWTW